MLIQMRESAKGFTAKVIIALLVVSFAVWGIGDVVRGGANNVVAKVDREEIFADEFIRSLQMLQANLGEGFTLDALKQSQFPDLVINELVDRKILEITAEEMGLKLDDETLLSFIIESPLFRNEENAFDKDRFIMVLRNSGLTEADYLQQTREGLLVNMLQSAGLLHNAAPNILAEALYVAANEQRSADLIIVDPETMVVAMTDDETVLEEIYASIGVRFATPETRKFTSLSFSAEALQDSLETAIDDAALRAYYEDNIERYTTPASREVLQLTVDSKEAADAMFNTLLDEDDIKARLLKEGAKTQKYSQTSALSDEVTDAVFSIEEETLSPPLESDFGWQMVYITNIQNAEAKPFEGLKKEIKEAIIAERLDNYIYEQSNALEDKLAAGDSLEEVAESLPFLNSVKSYDTAKDETASPEVMAAITPLQSGETTGLQFDGDNRYYIAQVDEVTASTIPPQEELSEEIEKTYLQREKQVKARSLANQLADALQNGESRAEVIKGQPVTQTFTGFVYRTSNTVTNNSLLKDKILTEGFIQELFSLQQGESTGAYPLPSGEFVVGTLKNILPSEDPSRPEAEDEMQQLQAELAQIIPSEVYSMWMQELRNRHDITINRDIIQAILQ